jgi:molybdate transport system ATP-binding protein
VTGGEPAAARVAAGVLQAALRVRRGRFEVAAELAVAPGEVLAVVGPNGAGKTSLLRALAGLDQLSAGRVVLGGTVLDDAAAGVWVPPEHRPVGYVFADHRLFPHLSAADNVAFGLRARGMGRAAARAAAEQWLDRVGVAEFAGVRPGRLSSGQAQRVALARALAPRPRLLLLDEPLSALDAGSRAGLRSQLRRLVADYDGCCLAVTHDPLDALVLADRIAVLEDGRIVQSGTPAEVARHPRTDHVARLVGLNLYRGTGVGTAVRLVDGTELAVAEPVRGPAFAAFPPTAVAVYRSRPDGSPRNCWPVTVTELEPHGGGAIRVRLAGSPQVYADVTAAAVAELRLAPGSPVWAAVKATEVAVYPA